uniref:DUF3868 domain-containing protein n=1 Tax=uncultured Dysgonomonas sp. TaxID=206096 RepID=UPI0026243C65|nr:DUF3868 domain-containing protein [uncultured Dysgonomonas sp.]
MVSSLIYTLSLWNSSLDLGFIEIRESSLIEQNGRMYIDLELDIRCLSVGSNQSLTFTPMLIKDNYHQELPAIIIYGSERFRAYRKWRICPWILSFKEDYNIYKVIEARNGQSVSFSYNLKTSAKGWMSDATLGFFDHRTGQLQTQ